MKTLKLFLLLTLILFFVSHLSYAQIVNNTTELNNAINAASPGTTIILADGIWNDVFIDIDKNGTATNPITITAENPGSVLMTGNSRVYMEGSYLTVSGLVFQDPANLILDGSTSIEPVFELRQCDYCKVIDNKIDTYNGTESQKTLKFKWVYLTDCQYNEIAYNSFIGKYGIGSIINDNRSLANADYLKIHHNYFADRTPINGINDDNDQDAIRIGTSTTSLSDSYSEVYENYFYNFFGEVEVISNKSGQNKYYNNTFRDYGGCLTLRHGNNCEVFGNYFFAENNDFTGGVRIIGEGHKVYNNYIEGINSFKPSGSSSSVTGGINIMNGVSNPALNQYFQVIDAEVVNNTFVNCDYALRVGTSLGGTEEPVNLTVANNIMYNTSINPYQITTSPSGASVSVGNLTNLSTGDLSDDGNFHRLTSGSAPIDAGIGSYPYLIQDILEGNRDANFDKGAEEFGANGMKLPYINTDVGVKIGFGAIQNPTLSVVSSILNFGLCGSSLTFQVNSNVTWTITESLSWLSLDVTSGSGPASITATVVQNTTGAERTGSISIDEIAGGSNLFTTISIVQSDIALSSEISILGTTSVGMQQNNANVAEEYAYNNDLTNYWTGNPDTEPEVSITFDLGDSYVLTEMGIHFWKADERTTTFSIEVSDSASGPFTTVLDNEVSANSGVTVNTEQIFNLGDVVGRYVKFIGIGNSSSTNWTSIPNVNIYGHPDCGGFEFQPILFLEGAYIGGGNMHNLLANEIPLNQPYSLSPYNYNGTENLSSIPTNMVDWILVEARSGVPSLTGNRATITVETKAGVLLTDGTVLGADGSPLSFTNLIDGTPYYFCIRHRNHLDVLTANAILASSNMSYDFSAISSQALGTDQMKMSSDGFALLYAGDFNQDGVIQTTDFDQWRFNSAILNTFSSTDGNLDGTVQTTDFDLWFGNKAKIGIVEIDF